MIQIQNVDHFNRVRAFAKAKGPQYETWLFEMLWYLHTYADQRGDSTPQQVPSLDVELVGLQNGLYGIDDQRGGWRSVVRCEMETRLYRDFAPASFGFSNRFANGGLIYHGDQQGWDPEGRYTDPLSAVLVADENPWSVHT